MLTKRCSQNYCPIRVRHDLYEDKRVRDACKIWSKNQVKEVMEVSRKQSSSVEFLGKIRMRLLRTPILGRVSGPKQKRAFILHDLHGSLALANSVRKAATSAGPPEVPDCPSWPAWLSCTILGH